MTHTHLTTDELVMIESYYHQKISVAQIATFFNRTRTSIYTVINFLKEGHMTIEYYQQYKENKRHCGRHRIVLLKKQQTYIKEKVAQGWTPDVIIGRAEESIPCSIRTLYRQFKEKIFDETTLPMKGKRKPTGHQERRGKQAFKPFLETCSTPSRSIVEKNFRTGNHYATNTMLPSILRIQEHLHNAL